MTTMGTILALITGIITIAGIIIGIRQYQKNKRETKLGFKINGVFPILNKGEEKLNLRMVHNGEEVERPLILLSGSIENTGTTDIDQNRIYEPLKLKIGDDFKWRDFALNDKSQIGQKKKILNEKEIELNWDLLKKNESLGFEALIELEEEVSSDDVSAITFDKLYEVLAFDYRITDLDRIEFVKDKSNRSRSIFGTPFFRRSYFLISIFLFSMFLFLFFNPRFSSKFFGKPFFNTDINYEIQNNQTDSTFLSSMETISESSVLLISTSGDKKIVSKKDFNNNYKINEISTLKKRDYLMWVIIFVLVFLISSFIFLEIKHSSKKKVIKYSNRREQV